MKQIQFLRLLLAGLMLLSAALGVYANSVSTLSASAEDAKKELENQRADFIRKSYAKYEYRIPARDGTLLFTSVYIPNDASATKPYPILLVRTPAYRSKPAFYGKLPMPISHFPPRQRKRHHGWKWFPSTPICLIFPIYETVVYCHCELGTSVSGRGAPRSQTIRMQWRIMSLVRRLRTTHARGTRYLRRGVCASESSFWEAAIASEI